MSTVLWANVLVDGVVVSDETDHPALYKHAEKLDAIACALGLPSFLAACDTTDQRCNIEAIPLPDGMASTNELMAVEGAWLAASTAPAYLEALRDHIVEQDTRFGLLHNQQEDVLAELEDVLAFVRGLSAMAQKFNFSVVP